MIDDLVIMAIWSIPSSMFAGLIAIALNKWAVSWKRSTRILIATIASTFPVLGVAGYALAELGGFPLSVLSMSPDEFLFPFGLQILMILCLSAPVASLLSRPGVSRHFPADVFE